ncbi:MAG: hypothetical protein ACYTBJ_04480 [Planctomycetota bacterium]|jgi:hypothetical protein
MKGLLIRAALIRSQRRRQSTHLFHKQRPVDDVGVKKAPSADEEGVEAGAAEAQADTPSSEAGNI